MPGARGVSSKKRRQGWREPGGAGMKAAEGRRAHSLEWAAGREKIALARPPPCVGLCFRVFSRLRAGGERPICRPARAPVCQTPTPLTQRSLRGPALLELWCRRISRPYPVFVVYCCSCSCSCYCYCYYYYCCCCCCCYYYYYCYRCHHYY